MYRLIVSNVADLDGNKGEIVFQYETKTMVLDAAKTFDNRRVSFFNPDTGKGWLVKASTYTAVRLEADADDAPLAADEFDGVFVRTV